MGILDIIFRGMRVDITEANAAPVDAPADDDTTVADDVQAWIDSGAELPSAPLE